ncbi:hypothetical protein B0T42_18255 [Rathayibacter sp. VKM Ac-2630]|nr:hypothetical protein B0T42_18255 [Rathayibacter sp. VKM Ac-2630]
MTGGDSGGGIKYLNSAGHVEFTFDGTAVTWLSRTTASAGIANVYIDGKLVSSVDRYSSTTKYQVPVFTKTGLADGVHTVKIAYSGSKNASATDRNLVIDAFDLIKTAPAPTPVPTAPTDSTFLPTGTTPKWVEQNNGDLDYSGSWRTMSGGDSGGSIGYLNSAGNVQFTFVGTAFRWLSRTTPSSGIADVYIDGTRVASVDRYSSTTKYQVPVFERSDLADTMHTVKIAYTGRKNSASSDKNLIVDAFELAGDGLAVGGVQAFPLVEGYVLGWNAPFSSDVVSYEVHRSDGSTEETIATVSDPVRQYRDESAALGVPYSYWITSRDNDGRVSAVTEPTTVTAEQMSTRETLQAAFDCPTPTKTVRTAAELNSALIGARPGDVIGLEDGVYVGKFALRSIPSSSEGVWLCGSPNAVLSSGTTSSGTALILNSANDVHLVGFSVKNSFQGIHVLASKGVQMAGLTVSEIGYEGVHFRNQTTDSLIVGSTITRTGVVAATYGEGVYVGTSDRNWCEYNGCDPDRTDRIAVMDNVIGNAGSDPIEAKEGTRDGWIIGNVVTGTSRTAADVNSLIMLSGTEWTAAGNTVVNPRMYGVSIITRADGSGNGNLVTANHVSNAPAYPVYVHQPSNWSTWGNVATCSNSGGSPISNVACTR